MALNQTGVIAQIRDLIAAVTGMERVYAQSETDGNRLPLGVIETPAALVMAGQTLRYGLSNGQEQHVYEVRVLVLESGGDYGDRAYSVLGFLDAIRTKFVTNVTLGARSDYALFSRCTGLSSIDWAEGEYTGHELVLEVSETAAAVAAPGS